MADNIKSIIEMKNHKNNLGSNTYDWFFLNLENNHLSKIDGVKRNLSIIENYDEEAKAYILHQLSKVNENAAYDLMKELKVFEPVVTHENYKHIKETIKVF